MKRTTLILLTAALALPVPSRPAIADWDIGQPTRRMLQVIEKARGKLAEPKPNPPCPDPEAPVVSGVPAARLMEAGRVPAKIMAAGQSVRRLCFGTANNADSCITVFAIGDGRFVTAAHALDGIEGRRDFCKDFAEGSDDICKSPGGFWVAGSTSKAKSIKPKLLRRGKYEPHADQKNSQNDDLAILCLEGIEGAGALEFASRTSHLEIAAGQATYNLGFPSATGSGFGDFDKITAPAVAEGTLNENSPERGIVTSNLLIDGMSGGPLLDAEGKLLGAARAGSQELAALLAQDADGAERNSELYRKGQLRTQSPQASGYIPASVLRDFVRTSPCKSCSAQCAKPL